ncbi:MAG: hypothetical protein JXA15_13050 [Spirochaetales bacterium]|nr:hypothetical protein [Spirochaetales bacterium]
MDEALVIDEIERYRQGMELGNCDFITFIPTSPRQEGVDILYFKSPIYKTIQVKGSRVYDNRSSLPTAWIVLPDKYFSKKTCPAIDFFVFVFHVVVGGKHKPKFTQEYLVVPFADMDSYIVTNGIKSSGGKYHFAFEIDLARKSIIQVRHKLVALSSSNFTKYWNNWSQL